MTQMSQLLVLATPHQAQHAPSAPASKIKRAYVVMTAVLLVSFNNFITAAAMTRRLHRGAVVPL